LYIFIYFSQTICPYLIFDKPILSEKHHFTSISIYCRLNKIDMRISENKPYGIVNFKILFIITKKE